MQRLLAFILIFLLGSYYLSQANCHALTQGSEVFNPFWEKVLGERISTAVPKVERRVFQQYSVSDYKNFKELLIDAMANKVTDISMTIDPAIKIDELQSWDERFFDELSTEIPWLGISWQNKEYIYQYDEENRLVFQVNYKITYFYDKNTEEDLKQGLMATMFKIIDVNMDMITREKAIHDWIVKHTSYDLDAANNPGSNLLPYTDYGAFKDGKAVCQGYAQLANRMLFMAGIQNHIVRGVALQGGQEVSHAWNLVRLPVEDWYHLDATFDDPIGAPEDTISYDYFNLNDNQISKDHAWDRGSYPTSTKTYNEADYRNKIEEGCSIFTPEMCTTKIECIRICGNWIDGSCSVHECFNLSVNIQGRGSVRKTPDRACYYRDQVTLTAIPSPGYFFESWSGDVSGSQNPLILNVDANKNVIAQFSKLQLSDAILILKVVVGLGGSNINIQKLDVNRDQKIGLGDAIMLLTALASEK